MDVWSPVELFPKEKLRKFQLDRLRSILSSAGKIEMYRRRFDALNIDPGSIGSIEEIRELPFTRKADLVRSYEDGSLRMPPTDLYRWHRTSGSTGSPVRTPDSRKSWAGYGDLAAAALYGMGVRKEDVALVCFGYGPFIAFWSYMEGLNNIGACLVPAGALSSSQRVEMISSFGVTILLSTPTYALQLAEAASGMGADLSKFLRLTVHTGEPCPPAVKKSLKDKIGVRAMDRFGTTETGGIAFECPRCSGIYHVQENHLIAEVIDPETKEPTPPGKIGELIVTPLFRVEVPIIRFKTENLVKVAESQKCACGRTLLSLQETENGVVVQRLDNLVKVRGVLIDPAIIAKTIKDISEIAEYRIIVRTKGNSDELVIKAELFPESEWLQEPIKSRLEKELKEKLLIRCGMEFVPYSTIDRFEEKAKRFIDLRKR